MNDHLETIRDFYREALKYYDAKRAIPEIDVKFYPYVGINHTIRVREGKIFVRIGEICREMPPMPHKGLAYILVGKLLGKRLPKGAREVVFVIRQIARDPRQGRSQQTDPRPQGRHDVERCGL